MRLKRQIPVFFNTTESEEKIRLCKVRCKILRFFENLSEKRAFNFSVRQSDGWPPFLKSLKNFLFP
jgi:hypothetical protein